MKTSTKIIRFTAVTASAFCVLTSAFSQITNLTLNIPTNVPPALVQAEIVNSARMIALMQIQHATLTQLEAANTSLTNFDAGNLTAARQIMATTIRATSDINKLNQIVAGLPAPASQSATNAP
jgi:hypothetical protein